MAIFPNGRNLPESRRAWVTLLTGPSYLPGVIILAYTLAKHNSAHPLIVLVTESLPQSTIDALFLEDLDSKIIVKFIQPLKLPNNKQGTVIAERFIDTWTKLRAFELFEYSTCCFLDADMAIYKNPDSIFDTPLPDASWIAAVQSCSCNLDKDSFAPANWKRENCPWTPQQHSLALSGGTPIPRRAAPPHTYALLNGGTFLYKPSRALWARIHHFFLTNPKLTKYRFPDQDFLADFFCGKWIPLSWKFNAVKTMENWHQNIWRDGEVRVLHYIVDKPWEKRVASDGIGGHKGRDGKTHEWWWAEYGEWEEQRKDEGELRKIVGGLVAAPLTEEGHQKQPRENVERGFPIPLPQS